MILFILLFSPVLIKVCVLFQTASLLFDLIVLVYLFRYRLQAPFFKEGSSIFNIVNEQFYMFNSRPHMMYNKLWS